MIFEEQTRTQCITKEQVWAAWKHVRSGGKGMGIDQVSVDMINANPRKYLYPLWVRMASGSYFPPAVKEKVIPKGNKGVRHLGIPTICDRVAQQVIRAELEPTLEPKFHENSFGSRPGRSAHQALEQCARLCWERWYVLSVDIKGFFDNLDHGILMQMLRKHTYKRHVLLYCQRWLSAPVQHVDGSHSEPRTKGTPQGGVISGLLANLYLHEAFDSWMETEHSVMRYERYMDDIVIHTRSREQTDFIYDRVKNRLQQYKLELNVEKTHKVYCYRTARFYKESKDVSVSFDFLGYTFKPRLCERSDGEKFWGFRPGISAKSKSKIYHSIRRTGVCRLVHLRLSDISELLAPRLRGWLNYYGHFRLSEMQVVFKDLNYRLVNWVQHKYKYTSYRKAKRWLREKMRCFPNLFEHWKYGFTLLLSREEPDEGRLSRPESVRSYG